MGGKSDIPHLKKRLQEENSELAKIGFYQSLYTLGEHQVLAELLWTLSESKNYRTRCAAANYTPPDSFPSFKTTQVE